MPKMFRGLFVLVDLDKILLTTHVHDNVVVHVQTSQSDDVLSLSVPSKEICTSCYIVGTRARRYRGSVCGHRIDFKGSVWLTSVPRSHLAKESGAEHMYAATDKWILRFVSRSHDSIKKGKPSKGRWWDGSTVGRTGNHERQTNCDVFNADGHFAWRF